MNLSIVATLFRSATTIEAFCQRASAAAQVLVGDDYEIVLVNDGSPDESLKYAVDIVERDTHVAVIDLSRNYGHHRAMMIGLRHALGELVFLVDSDIEEDPAWLVGFAEQMARDHCDVVYGVQDRRKGDFMERWSGACFHRFFRLITGIRLPANIVTARLMTRRYVDALIQHDEREIFIAGLWYITGFDQRPQVIHKISRGSTTYSFRRKIAVLVDSVTSFSNVPLVAIFYVGVLISSVAGMYLVFLVGRWVLHSRPIGGWTSVMVSIWLLGGLIICFIGVIGIYLSKIFSEAKRRPYGIVKHIYGRKHS